MRLPGGTIGNQEVITPLLAKLHAEGIETSFTVEKLCKDPDFWAAFSETVPDEDEQREFLIETSKYGLEKEDFDLNYVLVFRRTLPSETPKPENRWTDNFATVTNGLRREIPEGPHRLHSIILCDSLGNIFSDGGQDTDQHDAFTDGEIKVIFPEYNQGIAICKFKPAHEQNALVEYLLQEGAVTAEEILLEVTKVKHGVKDATS